MNKVKTCINLQTIATVEELLQSLQNIHPELSIDECGQVADRLITSLTANLNHPMVTMHIDDAIYQIKRLKVSNA